MSQSTQSTNSSVANKADAPKAPHHFGYDDYLMGSTAINFIGMAEVMKMATELQLEESKTQQQMILSRGEAVKLQAEATQLALQKESDQLIAQKNSTIGSAIGQGGQIAGHASTYAFGRASQKSFESNTAVVNAISENATARATATPAITGTKALICKDYMDKLKTGHFNASSVQLDKANPMNSSIDHASGLSAVHKANAGTPVTLGDVLQYAKEQDALPVAQGTPNTGNIKTIVEGELGVGKMKDQAFKTYQSTQQSAQTNGQMLGLLGQTVGTGIQAVYQGNQAFAVAEKAPLEARKMVFGAASDSERETGSKLGEIAQSEQQIVKEAIQGLLASLNADNGH